MLISPQCLAAPCQYSHASTHATPSALGNISPQACKDMHPGFSTSSVGMQTLGTRHGSALLTSVGAHLQDTFSQQVHELHRLVVRQRRLCAVCEDPAALNAHLAAQQAAAAQKLAVALQARANIEIRALTAQSPADKVTFACKRQDD